MYVREEETPSPRFRIQIRPSIVIRRNFLVLHPFLLDEIIIDLMQK